MEKAGYRENLEVLLEQFPGKVTISPKEAAMAMHVDVRTVYSAMRRVRDPLPHQNITAKRVVIPIAGLAKWLA